MPRRRMTKRRPKRKFRKRYSRRTPVLYRGLSSAFPAQIYTKLVYNDFIDLSGGANPYQTYTFRLNSIYDPDYTGVGHQPMLRDELSAIYNRYQVTGCSAKVDWVVSTTAGSNLCCTLLPNVTASVPTINESIPELSKSTSVTLGVPTGGNMARQRRYFNIKSIGQNHDVGNFQSLMSGNPSQQAFLHLIVQSLDKVTVPDVYAKVELTYYVRLFDRIMLAQS